MECFIETRFGDPILALDINSSFAVFGSALGQIGTYRISNKEQHLIAEMAEEGIKGIYIDNENVIYVSVGDIYALIIKQDINNQWQTDVKSFENRQHTHMICNTTQVLQHKTKVCLVVVQDSPFSFHTDKIDIKHKLTIFNSSSDQVEEIKNFSLPKYSVPYSFNDNYFTWIENNPQGVRVLKLLELKTLNITAVKYFDKAFGKINYLLMEHDRFFMVYDMNKIVLMELLTGEIIESSTSHRAEILSIFWYNEKEVLVSVDQDGFVYSWKDGRDEEIIDMFTMEGIQIDSRSRFFSMGYPYFIKAFSNLIMVSTDLGIFVLKSKFLEKIS